MASGSVGFFNRGISRIVQSLPFALLVLNPLASRATKPPPTEPDNYLKHGPPLKTSDRLWCQSQIEKVYYSHRIWPAENPTPKPPFDQMVPATAISTAVSDYMDKSDALAKADIPITPEELQIEINRMVATTQAPMVLKELFDALNNDPYLVAECLVRPSKVDSRYLEGLASGVLPITSNGHSSQHVHGNQHQPVYVLPAVVTENCKAWSPVRSGAPSARFGQAANLPVIWTGSEMIVWGGNLGSGATNTGGRYNPALDDWLPLPTASPAPDPRFNHTALWTGSEMIVWGGSGPSASTLNSGGRYNPSSNTWIATPTSNAPIAREQHTAVWTGSEMIVWGGSCTTPECTVSRHDTGGRYSPITDTWIATQITGAPSARFGHTAVWSGSKMIIWGGNAAGSSGSSQDGGRYNPGSDSWETTSLNAAPVERSLHSAVWTGSEMIIWGGTGPAACSTSNTSGLCNTGSRYDPVADTWTAISTSFVPEGRQFHTAVWTGTEMIIWGGQDVDFSNIYFNNGGRYNPVSDDWHSTAMDTNLPFGRWKHAAVWTGSEMIVWGGQACFNPPACNSFGVTNSGGRYNPTSNSWESTFVGLNVPPARTGHTAVWTGSHMIVWGVADNKTWRYNPDKNNWAQTTPVMGAPPSTRNNHSSIWTGAEMIVWGGCAGSCDLGTGGRYNASNNSWIATTPQAPTCGVGFTSDRADPRGGHTAVWSGSDMIIFGGGYSDLSGSDHDLNSWGRYAPGADEWACRTIAAGNIPSQRKRHTTVWSGSQMIVWGGNCANGTDGRCDEGEEDNDSGATFAFGDTWTTIAAASPPASRSRHTAIWTGNEMIVWGGSGNGVPLGDGSSYNTSAWTPITMSGAPTPRFSHTAVWTRNPSGTTSNDEMIIWGGSDGFPLDTGGRYNVASTSWLAVPTAGFAPEARFGHTAVWTSHALLSTAHDDRMIIWGGTGNSGVIATGSTYDRLAPFFTQQPPDIEFFANLDQASDGCAPDFFPHYTIGAAASGNNVTYQWQKCAGASCVYPPDWTDLQNNTGEDPTDHTGYTGVTSPTLGIHFPGCAQEAHYRLLIRDDNCSLTGAPSGSTFFTPRVSSQGVRCCS